YCSWAPTLLGNAAQRIDSLYRFGSVKSEAILVYTNKAPTSAYRGFGNPHICFAFESQVDIIAERLGMDPVEIRLKNATHAGDVSLHGLRIGSCGLQECIEKTTEGINWRQKRGKKNGRGVGIACATQASGSRVRDYCGSTAIIQIREDGKVSLASGESDLGQGAYTTMAQIAAEELGVPPEDISVSRLDTDVSPFGMGTWASRVTVQAGFAVKLAATEAKKQVLDMAAQLLEARVEDLECRERMISVKGTPTRGVSLADVSRAHLYRKGGAPIMAIGAFDADTEEPDKKTKYGNPSLAYPFAATVAEVEVDRETGRVTLLNLLAGCDLGKALNPLACEGQVEGAATQGVAIALTEELLWRDGKVQNDSFTDYRVPTAVDLPMIASILVEAIDERGPYGAKSVGEIPVAPTAPAIANAIYDAVGVRIKELPITPEKILAALREKEQG
ncbi:MAG: molybdopterin-dependent oxidoreductase, partial [Dehalococcoidia bacterium]|nr:molybdopterin-dependent oxidoreductase [Dehalococcoidia bacterium]